MTTFCLARVYSDWGDYAVIRLQDDIGVKAAVRAEISEKKWKTDETRDIQIDIQHFNFSTETDKRSAILALNLVISEQDYDESKHSGFFIFENL